MLLSKHNYVNLFSISFQIFCNIIYFGDFFLLKMILSRIFHKFSKFFLDFHQIFMIFCITWSFFYLLEHLFHILRTIMFKKSVFFNILYTFFLLKIFSYTLFSFSLENFFIFNNENCYEYLKISSIPLQALLIKLL